jgi:hypothetical protein
VGSSPNSGVYLRRRLGLAATLVALVAPSLVLAIGSRHSASRARPTARSQVSSLPASTVPAAPKPPVVPALVVAAPPSPGAGWETVALVHGHAAAWVAQRGGVTLLRFDQSALRLDLHAGSSDGGVVGWRYGDRISPSEIHHVVAAFNGGFKFSYPGVGFASGGHVALPLKSGLGSIVTYTNGITAVGAWRAGVPGAALPVSSVL